MRWLVKGAMCDLLPRTPELPGLVDTDVDGFLDQLGREGTWTIRAGLMLGAVALVLTPIMTVYLPLPSFLLPRSLRARHAERITGTRSYLLRQTIFLLKMYATMAWGQDPKVRARLGLQAYPPDPGTFREAPAR